MTIPAAAQPEMEFSGYLVNLPVVQLSSSPFNAGTDSAAGDQRLAFDLTRLRLRPTVMIGNAGRLVLEYEIDLVMQSAAVTSPDLPATTTRQLFDWRWEPLREDRARLAHFIDRLYYRHDFAWGNLVLGRQRIAWGSGRIWNPTDLFNPINPAAFDRIEKDGADLLSSKIYLGPFTDLTLVYNPRERWRDHNAGFRFRSNYHTYDISVIGGYFDRRAVAGLDFAGNLWVAGLRGEGIISADPEDFSRNFVRYIMGIDMQFTSCLYTLFEYQFNGEGRARRSAYDLPALAEGRIINLGRQYLFFQALYQLHPLLNAGLGYNANLVDGSGFVNLTLRYAWRDNFDLALGGQFFYGGTSAEYWYYPDALFLQGQYYF